MSRSRTEAVRAALVPSSLILRAACAGPALCLLAAPVQAHDAFGDLGPFYASILHPLVDPLQAALLVGTAAFLAGRSLALTGMALPVFIGVAAFAALFTALGGMAVAPPLLVAFVAVLAGLAAILPEAWTPRVPSLILVAVTGALTGLAPGPAEGAALQPFLGTAVGIASLVTLCWFALEAAGQRFTPLVPRVAGSWVAAIGILTAAFAA